jgi:hypothetical protein
MTSTQPNPKSVAIIHNTALPQPLGDVSRLIPGFVGPWMRLPANFATNTIDIATYNLPTETSSDISDLSAEERQRISTWQSQISAHDAFVFIIPKNVWAHTKPLKSALSCIPNHSIRHKPALVVSFGKEDDRPVESRRENPDHVPRSAVPMMREFLEGKGFQLIPTRRPDGPEFIYWADVWETSPTFPGGNLIEAWEIPAWNPCADAGRKLTEMLQDQ